MKYIVSQYGAGIAVGLANQEDAQEQINLAHNLFNTKCHESLLHGVLVFSSFKQFRKFLAFREFFSIRKQGTKNEFRTWREAFRRAAGIIDTSCIKENFMIGLINEKKHYYTNSSGINQQMIENETDYEC